MKDTFDKLTDKREIFSKLLELANGLTFQNGLHQFVATGYNINSLVNGNTPLINIIIQFDRSGPISEIVQPEILFFCVEKMLQYSTVEPNVNILDQDQMTPLAWIVIFSQIEQSKTKQNAKYQKLIDLLKHHKGIVKSPVTYCTYCKTRIAIGSNEISCKRHKTNFQYVRCGCGSNDPCMTVAHSLVTFDKE